MIYTPPANCTQLLKNKRQETQRENRIGVIALQTLNYWKTTFALRLRISSRVKLQKADPAGPKEREKSAESTWLYLCTSNLILRLGKKRPFTPTPRFWRSELRGLRGVLGKQQRTIPPGPFIPGPASSPSSPSSTRRQLGNSPALATKPGRARNCVPKRETKPSHGLLQVALLLKSGRVLVI